MTRSEMGQIMAFLLKHRRLDTAPSKKRVVDEKSLAILLRDASADERSDLEGMLRGFGYELISYSGMVMHGLSPGSDVFLLTRRLDEFNELFSERWIEEKMQVRGDKVRDRRIWFSQLWFVLFSMLYTMRDRGPTEVSRYVETTFAKVDLIRTTRDYINDFVRKLNPDEIGDTLIHECLTKEHGALLDQYVERFLALMTEGAMLERQGDDKYRQSLVSAAEIKSNYLQGLAPLFGNIAAASNPLEASPAWITKAGEAENTIEE